MPHVENKFRAASAFCSFRAFRFGRARSRFRLHRVSRATTEISIPAARITRAIDSIVPSDASRSHDFARPPDTSHGASAETGRVGAVRRSADHEEKNLSAARPIGTLPPFFAFVLHERDLHSFNAPRCFQRAPYDAGQHFRPRGAYRPKCCIAGYLALGTFHRWKKMCLAHDCDRTLRGWFSSQISDFLRR
jgi:hypothetical protein